MSQDGSYYLDMYSAYHAQHPQLSLTFGEGVESCGEDALFLSSSTNMMGVSDGVSAWSAYGIGNSGYLAFYLMSACRMLAEKKGVRDPATLFQEAVDSIWSLHNLKMVQLPNGSATLLACILKETPENGPFIEYANLGDCSLLIVRPMFTEGKVASLHVIHQSNKLYTYHEHAKGVPVPLQVVFYPAQGDEALPGQLESLEKMTLTVEESDLLIMASDGLWDNLTVPQILKLTADFYSPGQHLDGKAIASLLVQQSIQSNLKPDDVTVLVAFVRQRQFLQAM